jgi:ADP-ribosylglycohydrolase
MAVGDALGLPREGLSRSRASRLFGGSPLRMQFLGKCGMISDDAEHAVFTAQALQASAGDPQAFARNLAWRLRGWLLGLPAGIGLATLRAVLRLCIGVPPSRSGVHSAGNGAAMRAPILGAVILDLDTLRAHVQASTRLTHTDPRAEAGAWLIARAAHAGNVSDPRPMLDELGTDIVDDELHRNIMLIAPHLARGATPADYADALGLAHGVSGYVNHTVPVALYCWLRYPDDFRTAVESAILLGGDTDTVGAIVGGLAGATLGADAIPNEWLLS